jgi:hypothetical protein
MDPFNFVRFNGSTAEVLANNHQNFITLSEFVQATIDVQVKERDEKELNFEKFQLLA